MENEVIEIRLRDYLMPNGIYPYEALAPKLEELHSQGKEARLISAPGYVMGCNFLSDPENPCELDEYPWASNYVYYKTANDMISVKNGIQIVEYWDDVNNLYNFKIVPVVYD